MVILPPIENVIPLIITSDAQFVDFETLGKAARDRIEELYQRTLKAWERYKKGRKPVKEDTSARIEPTTLRFRLAGGFPGFAELWVRLKTEKGSAYELDISRDYIIGHRLYSCTREEFQGIWYNTYYYDLIKDSGKIKQLASLVKRLSTTSNDARPLKTILGTMSPAEVVLVRLVYSFSL